MINKKIIGAEHAFPLVLLENINNKLFHRIGRLMNHYSILIYVHYCYCYFVYWDLDFFGLVFYDLDRLYSSARDWWRIFVLHWVLNWLLFVSIVIWLTMNDKSLTRRKFTLRFYSLRFSFTRFRIRFILGIDIIGIIIWNWIRLIDGFN